MQKFDLILADDLYKILEKTFTPEEIEVFINQAVRRQIEETLKIKTTPLQKRLLMMSIAMSGPNKVNV